MIGFRWTAGSRASILDFNKSSSLFTTSLQSWMIDNVVVPLASGYGLTEEYKYLKSSILHYLTGLHLYFLCEKIPLKNKMVTCFTTF
jgi:ubiquinone/menaquinone biosynthesis C-methylase UbiE